MAHWKLVIMLAVGALGLGILAAALGWLGEFVSLALAAGVGWAVWRVLPDQTAANQSPMIARASEDAALASAQANAAEEQVKELRAQLTKREWEQRQMSERLVEAERAVAAAQLEVKNAMARVVEFEAANAQLITERDDFIKWKKAVQDEHLCTLDALEEREQRIVRLEQISVEQGDLISRILMAIRLATGINSDLSPLTITESLDQWHGAITAQLQEFAEYEAAAEMRAKEAEQELARARAEFDQLQQDHQALEETHHELLANLGKDELAQTAPEPLTPDKVESDWGKASG